MGEEEKYGGHVVVMPYPSQGHINPLLQFAKRLASKGVKATLAATHYTRDSITAPDVAVETISDGFDQGGFAQAGSEAVFLSSFKANGSRSLSRLVHNYRSSEYPVTCIVYDSFLPWALDVARQHGILGASFFTNNAAVCSIFSRIHRGLLTLPLKQENVPLNVPGLPPLNFPDMPSFLRLPESYPAYLAMKLSQYSNLDEADWIFGNTFEYLEGEAAEAASEYWPATLVGPMVPSAYLDGQIEDEKGYGSSLWKPQSEECNKWLQHKPPQSVAYVAFGSMVSLTPKQMKEIAWGLKNSNFYFLWVVKDSELNKLPEGFMDSIGGKGLIVQWCNQLELLAHTAVGCFVTHCGWNSMLEGLSLGVPMVGVPQWADQLTDGKFVEIWGVGVRAREDEEGIVRREEVLGCLRDVMEGERSEKIRVSVRKWRALAKKAMSKGGSSDKNIDKFVEHLRGGGKEGEGKKKRMSGS